ncbi:MAG: DUF481 domain-containing protein [Acidobacteriota bacterium]|nr:DUF481 domain-containing protein [Acidobacteriota bacterium]MDQ7087468.1 DUF481 domain-containing protein [Acidobacteriota bacterium]
MKRMLAVMIVSFVLAMGSGPACAEDAEKDWTNTAEFAAVITGGNSQTTTLSIKDTFKKTYAGGELTLDMVLLKAKQTDRTPRNEGGTLFVDEISKTNAEYYALQGKYRGQIRDGLFWYAGGGWERNQPAGLDNRVSAGGGLGYLIFRDATMELSGELGANYVDESYVSGTLPDGADYINVRGFIGYTRKLSPTAHLDARLEMLQNMDDSDDLRVNAEASVTASLTSQLALKVGYSIKYDKSPVMILLSDPADPTAPAVFYEFDDTDTIFAASLVINY